jgi:hypothetical protein
VVVLVTAHRRGTKQNASTYSIPAKANTSAPANKKNPQKLSSSNERRIAKLHQC